MIIFKHALKISFRSPVNILVVLVVPIGCVFVPVTYENIYPLGMYIYGLIMMFSAFLLSRPLIEDRMNKTIVRISASPTHHLAYLSSHLLAYLLILFVQNILFTVGLYFYWQDAVNNYFVLLSVYMMFSVLAISFCLFWNSLFKSYTISMSLFSLIVTILALFGGLTIPLDIFPEGLRLFAMILPTFWLTYGIDGIYQNQLLLTLLANCIILIYSGVLLLIGSMRRF